MVAEVKRVFPGVQQKQNSNLPKKNYIRLTFVLRIFFSLFSPRRVLLECLLDRNKVFERLGHFASLNMQMTRMHKKVAPIVILVMSLGKCKQARKGKFSFECKYFLKVPLIELFRCHDAETSNPDRRNECQFGIQKLLLRYIKIKNLPNSLVGKQRIKETNQPLPSIQYANQVDQDPTASPILARLALSLSKARNQLDYVFLDYQTTHPRLLPTPCYHQMLRATAWHSSDHWYCRT